MLKSIFNDTKYIEKALDATWLRQQVISNNIANADTPNFKASRVEFEDAFRSALESADFAAKRTRDKHMAFSDDFDGVSPRIVQNTGTTMRQDGNNVDIDYENAELAKNQIYYNLLVEKLNSQFARLKMAINEGK